jgi:hypothetical protein
MSEEYKDDSFNETDWPVSNPGQLYDDVPGMSRPRAVPEKPREEYRLPRSIRRCVARPGDRDYQGLFSGSASFGGVPLDLLG